MVLVLRVQWGKLSACGKTNGEIDIIRGISVLVCCMCTRLLQLCIYVWRRFMCTKINNLPEQWILVHNPHSSVVPFSLDSFQIQQLFQLLVGRRLDFWSQWVEQSCRPWSEGARWRMHTAEKAQKGMQGRQACCCRSHQCSSAQLQMLGASFYIMGSNGLFFPGRSKGIAFQWRTECFCLGGVCVWRHVSSTWK